MRFAFIFFTLLAGFHVLAQESYPDLSQYDFGRASYSTNAGFVRQGRYWHELNAHVEVTLKPRTHLYSLPEYASNPRNLPAASASLDRVDCSGSEAPLNARLLFTSPYFSVVQIQYPTDFCASSFNRSDSNQNIVFIRNRDVMRVRDVDPFANRNAPCRGDSIDELLNVMKKAAQDLPAPILKTKAEMERYLNCYSTPHQADYDHYYRKLFDLAGRTFQLAYLPGKHAYAKPILKASDYTKFDGRIPYIVRAKSDVMKCIGLRESRWDRTTRSPTGALGIGQQVDTNIKDIHHLLATQSWAQKLWKKYFERARREFSPDEWKWLTTNPLTHKTCTEEMAVKDRDAPCPINSIAAMALYQLRAELQIRRESKLKRNSDFDFNSDQAAVVAVIQGGTNNAGIGATRRGVGVAYKIQNWVKSVVNQSETKKRKKEVADYMRYLHNCLYADSWKPMGPGPAKKCTP